MAWFLVFVIACASAYAVATATIQPASGSGGAEVDPVWTADKPYYVPYYDDPIYYSAILNNLYSSDDTGTLSLGYVTQLISTGNLSMSADDQVDIYGQTEIHSNTIIGGNLDVAYVINSFDSITAPNLCYANGTNCASSTPFNLTNVAMLNESNNFTRSQIITGNLTMPYARFINLNVAVPTNVGEAQMIGQLTAYSGASLMEIWITIGDYGYSQTKRYFLPTKYGGTGHEWTTVVPISTSGAYGGYGYEDMDLEIKSFEATHSLRLRRTKAVIGYPGTAKIIFMFQGESSDTFVQNTTKVNVTAPKLTYPGTSLTQDANWHVGIRTTNPQYDLDVNGQLRVTNYSYMNYTYFNNTYTYGRSDFSGTGVNILGSSKLIINGSSATTGNYTLATFGGSSSGFGGTNDINSGYHLSWNGISYSVAGAGVKEFEAMRLGYQKDGSWNMAGGGPQVNADYVLALSRGGGGASNPVMTEVMRIKGKNGYVGINTSYPSAMIDVNGDAKFNKNITAASFSPNGTAPLTKRINITIPTGTCWLNISGGIIVGAGTTC